MQKLHWKIHQRQGLRRVLFYTQSLQRTAPNAFRQSQANRWLLHTFIQTTASYSDDDHRSMMLDGIVCHGKSKSFSLVQNLIFSQEYMLALKVICQFSSSSSSRRVKKLRQINICQSCTILWKMVSFPLYSNIQISIFWINFINESFCMSTQIKLTFLIKLLKRRKRKIVNSP